MNKNKWRVRKGELESVSGYLLPCWEIIPPDWSDQAILDERFGHEYRYTHAEALAVADQLARTVEVTLPRKSSVLLCAFDSEGRRWARDKRDNEICYTPNVPQENLKDILLDFLSFHYRNERNKDAAY